MVTICGYNIVLRILRSPYPSLRLDIVGHNNLGILIDILTQVEFSAGVTSTEHITLHCHLNILDSNVARGLTLRWLPEDLKSSEIRFIGFPFAFLSNEV